jgi:hypothetical protein
VGSTCAHGVRSPSETHSVGLCWVGFTALIFSGS